MSKETSKPTLMTLPAEIRVEILSYVVTQPPNIGFRRPNPIKPTAVRGMELDPNYSSSANLTILTTCRQFRQDVLGLAFRSTTFHITDMHTSLTSIIRPLSDYQIRNLRRLVIVVGDPQLLNMVLWQRWPFDMEELQLDSLTVAMFSAPYLHFPSNYSKALVRLLRRLENVKRLVFMLNGANVGGFFRQWYNQLIGLVLKEDHHQRYCVTDAPRPERTWWMWRYDDAAKWFELLAQKPKPIIADEAEYMEMVKPLVQKLISDMEDEPENESGNESDGF